MACYIVTFEVANIEKRNELKGRIQTYGTYCPIHENCWALVTENTASQVRDYLMEIINPPDKIFIIKSGVEAAWNTTYGTKNADWLKEKL